VPKSSDHIRHNKGSTIRIHKTKISQLTVSFTEHFMQRFFAYVVIKRQLSVT